MAEQKSLQLTRVSELDPIGSDRCGSGCLLAPDLLLTAAHVVGPVGSSCDWRRITDETGRMTDWRRARVAWCSEELDGALLVSADGAAMAPGMLPIRLGRLTGDAPIIVQAVGFPTSHARHDGQGLKSDTCQVFATVMPLSDLRDGPLRMNVLNASPLDRRAWGGVSGAALFAHGVCLGWIVQVPEGFGSDALKATRVHMLAADSEAAEHLRRAGIVPAVLAVDASGVAGERRERYAQAVLDVFCTPTGGGWAHLALRGSEDGLTHSLADLASTSSVIVLGAPGAGKSTLLQQALARATRDGCMPLWLPLNTLPAEGS